MIQNLYPSRITRTRERSTARGECPAPPVAGHSRHCDSPMDADDSGLRQGRRVSEGGQGGTSQKAKRTIPESFPAREDVYARRWERAEGLCGHSPAAIKNWKAINESRPEERKKVDKKTRKYLPVTDTVIEDQPF